jgi:hypothetical protein
LNRLGEGSTLVFWESWCFDVWFEGELGA